MHSSSHLRTGRTFTMDHESIEKYYSNELVKREIADYCRGRWVAIEGGSFNSRVFLRYWRKSKPLSISEPPDVEILLKRFRAVKPRTIYGSINIYSKLSSKADPNDPKNIVYTSPIWDIDGDLRIWKNIIEAARIIVDELEKLGIIKSVFIKWSGEGAHVHVHERCFSSDLLSKYNPLDIAYSIVEYVLGKCRRKLAEITSASNTLKIENEIDLKRVFTAPLSLHRKRDLCCVCFKPNVLDSFEIEWANPQKFKHDDSWREYVEGEGDEAAIKALKSVGGYRGWADTTNVKPRTIIAMPKPVGIKQTKKIGRFQVMGLLQAARYYLLMGDPEKAKSFGLNRAIFYAWAKKHAREVAFRRALRSGRSTGIKEATGKEKAIRVGDEVAFISDRGWFIIGGQEQRPEDYDRQIVQRIENIIPYERAWQAALEYLERFDREVLLDQRKFFKQAYEPIRDKFVEEVVLKPEKTTSKPKELSDWFKKSIILLNS